MKKTNNLSRAKVLDLHNQSKFEIALTQDQKNEFWDISEGYHTEINDNRKKNGEFPIYETDEVVPMLADLEFVRSLAIEVM